MAHFSRQDSRWLSPTTASQPTWDTRSGPTPLSQTQPGAIPDFADSYEDFSGDNGEGDSTGKRHRRSSTGPWASGNSISSTSDGTELWACPFCKWKPLRYQGCHTYKLKEISRVKQHLRRKHRIPPHCDVCSEEFADEEARLSHVRAQNCHMWHVDTQKTREGVTLEQQELLERRAERNKTKVEQWYSIYEILFPGETPPASPYVDLELSPQMHSFQAFLASEAAATILNKATLAQIPPHLQRDEILALSRAVFEQAMPALLQQYESSKHRRLGSRKQADRGEDEEGLPSRVSSDTWISVPPVTNKRARLGLDEFGVGFIEADDNEISTVPSPVTSVHLADPHKGEQQCRRLGINAMVATTPNHQVPMQLQHHQQLNDHDNMKPLHQQAGRWELQHQDPLSPAFCGAWVNETTAATTTQQHQQQQKDYDDDDDEDEEVTALSNPDMLYCNFDMFVPPYY